MITRFFSTSKPIHFILIAFVTFVIFMSSRLIQSEESIGMLLVIRQMVLYGLVLISLFVLDFLVSKNNLTKKNNYKLLLFGLFLMLIPATLQTNNVLFANVFILFALRRIISLRSNLNVKRKLFDAGFWIGIATLFYFWSILFFALIFAALVVHSLASIKDWIIPVVGLLTVAVLLVSYFIIMDYNLVELSRYLETTGFDFTAYNHLNLIIAISILVSLGLWALLFYIKNLNEKSKRRRLSHILVIVALVISCIIILFAPSKNGGEFIFMFAPLSIIMANYLESIKELWFAELFVWLLILASLSTLFI